MIPSAQKTDQTFPREARIRKSKEFIHCNKVGKRQYSKHFIFVLTDSSTDRSKLGLVVSKKVNKRAVERNRIKRMLRDLFRTHSNLFPKPIDLVIVARQNANDCSYTVVKDEFINSLKKISLLQDNAQ